jgi:hypothetical protein
VKKSRAILLPPGNSLVLKVADILLGDEAPMENKVVVFPGKRPGHFLRKELARRLGRPYRPPRIFSMDEFADFLCERAGLREPLISDISAVALLYKLHRRKVMPGGFPTLSLEEFLPWGFRLFSDIEDLMIEGIPPAMLEGLERVGPEEVPSAVRTLLCDVRRLYEDFYALLSAEGMSTRSRRYRLAGDAMEKIDLEDVPQVLPAGFYGLTRSERKIFSILKENERAVFLFQEGPGMGDLIRDLGMDPERAEGREPRTSFFFYKAADVHGEVMELKEVLAGEGKTDVSRVIVLPEAGALFPVVQQVLPRAGKFNISMGYPILRTPVYSLFSALSRALESSEEGCFFLPDYLGAVLHPYIKNIQFKGSSTAARICWHTVEEELTPRGPSFISPGEVEDSAELARSCLSKLSRSEETGASQEELRDYLVRIHRLLFDFPAMPQSIRRISRKLMELVSAISMESPANRHPFSGSFLKRMLQALDDLAESLLGEEKLSSIRDFFGLLESYLGTVRVPFQGTPLRGLQVLGFLEARNLLFDKVYFLDLNEKIMPSSGREESLLSVPIRRHLNLPTGREREAREVYYFHTLVRSAGEAHLFFSESGEKEKSRLIEELVWEEQKAKQSLDIGNLRNVFFQSDFSQDEPAPVPKSPGILKFLGDFVFSASSLDEYLYCPLKFYYRRVLNLRERGTPEEEMNAGERGEMVHAILAGFFSGRINRPLSLQEGDFKEMDRLVDHEFSRKYGPRLQGRLNLVKSQIKTRMRDVLLLHGKKPCSYSKVLACECKISIILALDGDLRVQAKGRLDRVDLRGEETFILDYKTGSGAGIPGYDRFTSSDRREWPRTLKSVQLPFYVMLYLSSNRGLSAENVNSSLLLLGSKAIRESSLFKEGDDREEMLYSYRKAVSTLVSEILDPGEPFQPSRYTLLFCPDCDFRTACGRQWITGGKK